MAPGLCACNIAELASVLPLLSGLRPLSALHLLCVLLTLEITNLCYHQDC